MKIGCPPCLALSTAPLCHSLEHKAREKSPDSALWITFEASSEATEGCDLVWEETENAKNPCHLIHLGKSQMMRQ